MRILSQILVFLDRAGHEILGALIEIRRWDPLFSGSLIFFFLLPVVKKLLPVVISLQKKKKKSVGTPKIELLREA